MTQLVVLNTPNSQGVSRRKTLEGQRKTLKKKGKAEHLARVDAELEPVPLEPFTDYLVRDFDALSSVRDWKDGFPQSLPFSEIKAYCELTDTTFEPWEVNALRVMDNAFIDESFKILAARNKQKAGK